MKLNPLAVVTWVLGALIGFLLDDAHGAAVGAASIMTISILLTIFG